VDAAWLQKRGVSSPLRSKYSSRGWLEQVTRGVYRRPAAALPVNKEDTALRWQSVVVSLQTILECPAIVGGRTALELQGFGHYLSRAGAREVHLYSDEPLPTWVGKLTLDTNFVFHNAKKLFKNKPLAGSLGTHGTKPPTSSTENLRGDLVQQSWGQWNWPLTMSAPERAVLELLDEVPERETFHQADVLMEGLRNLSPRKLQTLLVDCRSVKVKRLFLWFAERHNHAWLQKLDRKPIDLGSGKRMLVRGGKLDTKFNITVPENLDAAS
jgi:Transcriptional regulator, AbiEi antitoxin, Type IV TA system/Transcriptional regulator, AbiEi antitoxin N-terminal domain